MPVELAATTKREQTFKGTLIAFPVVAVAFSLAKLNFYHGVISLSYFAPDMGWPFKFVEYGNSSPYLPTFNYKLLAVDIFFALATLVSLIVLMQQICRDWPRLNLRTLFVLMNVLVFSVWLAKYDRTIHQILRNETGFEINWSFMRESWLIRGPLLLGGAALSYGVCAFVWHCANFHYRALLALLNSKEGTSTHSSASVNGEIRSE